MRQKPHLYFREGRWHVDLGNVVGWSLPSIWASACEWVATRNRGWW